MYEPQVGDLIPVRRVVAARETWLSGSTEEAFKLARSYAADQMRIVQSGSERKDLLAA